LSFLSPMIIYSTSSMTGNVMTEKYILFFMKLSICIKTRYVQINVVTTPQEKLQIPFYHMI